MTSPHRVPNRFSPGQGVRPLSSGLRMLSALSHADGALSQDELGSAVGISTKAASRIVDALVSEDLVVRCPDGRVVLSAGSLAIGLSASWGIGLLDACRKVLPDVVEDLDRAVSLAVRCAGSAVTLVEVHPADRTTSRGDSPRLVRCGPVRAASGAATSVLHPSPAWPGTVPTPGSGRPPVNESAIDSSVDGIRAVAVAVVGPGGSVAAAIETAASTAGSYPPEVVDRLADAADQLSLLAFGPC